MSSATEIFFKRAGEHANANPATVGPATSLRDVVGLMTTDRHTAVIVVDDDDTPVGIVTDQDIVRRAAFNADPAQPVSDIMTQPVRAIGEDDRLFVAIARMRRLGHRHMPVIDGDGRLKGLLDLRDAMGHAASDLFDRVDELTRDDTIDGLREIKAAQPHVAERLLDDGVSAVEVQALLTHINGDIYRRVTDINLAAKTAEDGIETAPVPFSLIVMGSGGRGENFLYPDQDYGFILADYPADRHDSIDAWFTDLAKRVSDDLDTVGIPYCTGDVMATNPLWRKTITQWKKQIDDWNERAYSATLLHFDIFFDFIACRGEPSMPGELRRHVTEVTRGNQPFLRALYISDRDHGTALRWFGRFATERDDPAHKGKINLKLYGTLPLVEGIRMLALEQGIEETGTLARIEALRGGGTLKPDEAEYLDGAYKTICNLLLRRQIADSKEDRAVSSYVHPRSLSRRERARLREAFRAIDDLRARINFELGGEIF